MKQCSVGECAGEVIARGWCMKHYQRWRRNGDVADPFTQRICAVDGCDEPAKARGWCERHYARWRTRGTTERIGRAHLRRPDITYAAALSRRVADLGPASAQQCADCGERAYEWSYDGTDPNELVEPGRTAYSLDPARYRPLCRACRAKHDRRRRPA